MKKVITKIKIVEKKIIIINKQINKGIIRSRFIRKKIEDSYDKKQGCQEKLNKGITKIKVS